VSFPEPSFTHLRGLTDAVGLYEHASGTTARREHGYCVDDVARGLVVVCRELPESDANADLLARYLSFTLAAQAPDGRFRNRRGTDWCWRGSPSVEDCWGRGLWGLGAVVASEAAPPLRDRALAGFDRGATWRSPWSRAMAFAALGAADVLKVRPEHLGAQRLIASAAETISGHATGPDWLWPEPRLTYANAVVPEALLAAGAALDDPALVSEGVRLLGWLLDRETRDGHLSVAPVGGRAPSDFGPRFDQQPIEVAAIADACARAFTVTGEHRWLEGVWLAASWFLGDNDVGVPLYDAVSGGGCDGLERDGRNENQGAESTLAVISTLQQARSLLTPSLR
jgi:hypothetical protein